MAGLWRAVRSLGTGKQIELKKRANLICAINSGQEEEVVHALEVARQECIQWKGRLALTHEETCAKMLLYLTAPFPRMSRDEKPITPSELAEFLGHHNISRRLLRETQTYAQVTVRLAQKSGANEGGQATQKKVILICFEVAEC